MLLTSTNNYLSNTRAAINDVCYIIDRSKKQTNERENVMSEKNELQDDLFYTGYEVGQALNIRPQMVYTYMKKGYIPTRIHNGRAYVSGADAKKWSEDRKVGAKTKGQKGIRL
jgi:hypothetical protein